MRSAVPVVNGVGKAEDDVLVDVVFQYNNTYETNILCFANSIYLSLIHISAASAVPMVMVPAPLSWACRLTVPPERDVYKRQG